MKPTTIEIGFQDTEVMPFIDSGWLSRGTKQDRLTMVRPIDYGPLYGQRGVEDFWGVEDLDGREAGRCIAAALDHFWPGWRERNPKHAGGTTP